MDLLPEELRKALPPLYSQESSGSPTAYALCPVEHNAYYAPARSYVALGGHRQQDRPFSSGRSFFNRT